MIGILKAHIVQKFSFLKHSKLLLAVSGGIDSVVMTHVLHRLGYDIALAHVNFQLRGAASDADEIFVKTLGNNLQISVYSHLVETEKDAKENGFSIQMAARNLRYQWFETLLREHPFDYLLTAHHLDDSIETFFINLNRKSGLGGLTGIPEINGKIIRPFLNISRSEIEQYAKENQLTWTEDASNATLKYERNQIRHLLIPVLEQINPDFKNSFQISQQYLLQSSLMIEDYIKLIKPNFWIEKTDNISINLRALQSISHYESILYETLKEYHFTDWSAIMELINSQSGKKVLSETHQLWKDRDQLLLIKNTEKFDSLPSTHEQNTEEINKTPKFYEAVFNLQEKKKTVKTINKNSRKPELEKIKIENSIELSNMSYHIERLKRSDSINFKKRGIEYFDAETIEFPLFIRHWQIGDFFFPLGMNGRKKLSDYFVDLKLSVLDKEKIWLLCDAKDNILWIIGYRIDNRFKVTETTKNLIKITPTP